MYQFDCVYHPSMTERVQAVAKAAQILAVFDRAGRRLTVREISAAVGIPRSTVHGICRTLVDARFLEAMPDSGFQLGIGLAMLGGQVLERLGLVDAVQQPIQQHLDAFGLEVHVAVYMPGAVFYVYRKRAATRVSTMNRTGRRWAIHTTGCGRAVLATLSQAALERELPPIISGTERAQLDAELARFPRDRFIVTNVSQPGLISVAAPIFDRTGLAVGALGVSDTVQSMNRTRVAAIGAAVRAASTATSRAVGWSEPTQPWES